MHAHRRDHAHYDHAMPDGEMFLQVYTKIPQLPDMRHVPSTFIYKVIVEIFKYISHSKDI